MLLSDIADLIVENVEKLIPHLKEQIKQYIDQRKQAGLPMPAEYDRYYNKDQWYDKAVDWVLRADPRFLKDLRKKKPLSHSKSPFVKDIIRWWLNPDSTLEFPEDIETTGEALQTYNRAKQQGLKADTSQFKTFDELQAAIEPFIGEERPNSYESMGLELEWQHDPWRMYKVDKFIPGEVSSLYPGEVCHKAFEGTEWCVKYKHTFERSYTGSYYLILHGRKRFALINFPSLQFKNTRDKPIATTHRKEAGELLQLLFADRPEFIADLALASISKNYGDVWGDFTPFHPLFGQQATEILQSPLAREMALKTPTTIKNLAKLINEWPNFEGWPEGKATIQQIDIDSDPQNERVVREYITDHGRDKIIEQRLPTDAISKYVKWVGEKHKDQAIELIPAARAVIEQAIQDNPTTMRSALRFLAIESTIHKPQRWLQLEKIIEHLDDPRSAVAYVRYMGLPALPDLEALIAQDPRASQFYTRITGIDLSAAHEKKPTEPQTPQQIVQRAIFKGDEIPDQEPIILQDLDAAINYAQHVIGPWPELEKKLRQHGTQAQKDAYAQNVLYNSF